MFLKRMWKLSFLTILYAHQNLKRYIAWALLGKSAGWVGCYAKYTDFKHTSWTEMLQVVTEFYSTLLNGRIVSSPLKEKNEYVWFALKGVQVKWR